MASRRLCSAYFFCLACACAADPEFEAAKRQLRAGKVSEAREAFQQIANVAPSDSVNGALARVEMGRIDLDAARYSDVIANVDKAHAVLSKRGNRTDDGVALTLTGMARVYTGAYDAALQDLNASLAIARETKDRAAEIARLNNLGSAFYFQARYGDALNSYQSALRLVERSTNEAWFPARKQLTAANVATVYQKLGQYRQALDVYKSLLASQSALTSAEQAQLLANVGTLYRRLGDPLKALDTYRSAQDLYKKHGMRNGEIAVLNNIGIAQGLDLHRYGDALAAFDRALAMAEESKDRPVALHSLLYRAETRFRMDSLPDAARDFDEAVRTSRELHASDETWKALYGLSRVATSGESEKSVALLREAIGEIESLRNGSPSSLRTEFLADKRQVYDALIFHLAQGSSPNVDELFHLVELSRARDAQEKASVAAVNLKSVQTAIPENGLLLEYLVGEEFVLIVWISRESSGIALRPKEPGVRRRLTEWNKTFSDPSNEDWRPAARDLSNLLLSGISGRLRDRKIDQLVIVPDRETAAVPFDVLALPEKASEPLLQRFTITYVPSAGLLHHAAKQRRIVPPFGRMLLAFADPAPGNGSERELVAPLHNTSRLPAATAEVRSAAQWLGGRSAVFTGSDARKENLKQQVSLGYPILHLATHAFSDPDDPSRSYLLFAAARPEQRYDYAFLKEISGLRLKGVDLVTVSACETETGKLVEGEGVESFGRAFLASGARSTVTTLWRVADQSAAALMESFYAGLAEGLPAGAALRQAKLHFLSSRNGISSHPFYWAAFVLNGDAAVRAAYLISWSYSIAGILAVAGAFLLWFGSKRR